MQQANKSVTFCDLLHYLHSELVVVGRYVRLSEYRGKLVLCGCGFVVLGLCENSEFPKLHVKLAHEGFNLRLNYTEIVVVKLLSLEGFCAEKSSSREDEILALIVKLFRHKEILLLRTYACSDAGDVGVRVE